MYRLRHFQFQPRLFSAPEIFIPGAHGTKNRRHAENGVDLWRRFLGPES